VDSFEGFREFVQGRGPALGRVAYLLTGDRTAAEELLQAALVKTASRWRRVVAGGNPEAYVRRVMVNERIDWWRRRGRHEVAMPEPPDRGQADPSETAARRLDLNAALAQLAPRQRAVVVLRFYLDLSEVEAAQTLGCAVGTVKSQTSQALARLRQLVPAVIDSTEVKA
jgi:RNA polymerase sigma-70 factor (sigma-E family)